MQQNPQQTDDRKRPPRIPRVTFDGKTQTVPDAPPPNTVPLVAPDFLKEYFGPDNTISYVGDIDDAPPEPLLDFMAANDFAKRYFQIILSVSASDTDPESSQTHFVKCYTRQIPSLEHIARVYGPGNYSLNLIWREHQNGKVSRKSEMMPLTISDKCEADHIEYLRMRKIEQARQDQERIRRLKVDRTLDDATLDPVGKAPASRDPKDYVREIVEMADALGLKRRDESGLNVEKLLTLLAPLGAAALNLLAGQKTEAQASINQLLTLMLSQAKESNQQLLEFARAGTGQGATMNAIREYKEMVMGALDLREALKGDQKTVADRVFDAIENVLPHILELAAKRADERTRDPRYLAARQIMASDPNFQAAIHDPAIMRNLIMRWDDVYGWRQTDEILTVAQMPRPAECPRDPAKELPVNMRERSRDGGEPQGGNDEPTDQAAPQ